MHNLDPATAEAIVAKATAFANSYGAAMSASLDPTANLDTCAAALAAHYSPHFIAFAHGAPPAKIAEAYNSKPTPNSSSSAEPSALDKITTLDTNKAPEEISALDKITAIVAAQLRRFDAVGLGWVVKMVGFEVQPYSAGAAQVWLTWENVPKEGCEVAAWSWTNIYGYRAGHGEGDKGYWEYSVIDEEIEKLLARFPKFFEVEV